MLFALSIFTYIESAYRLSSLETPQVSSGDKSIGVASVNTAGNSNYPQNGKLNPEIGSPIYQSFFNS